MTLSRSFKPARPLVLIYVAVIAALGAIWIRQRFFPLHGIGEGPAGPSVELESFQRVWHDDPVVVLGLGDSVTAGYGSTPGHSFVQRLTAPPVDEYADMKGRDLASVFPRMTVLNKAISGSTSSAVVKNELIRLAPFPADALGVIILSTGGNDLIHDYGRTPPRPEAMYGARFDQVGPWIAEYASRLDGIVARLEELFPGGAEIFMLSIFDPTDGIGDIANAGLPAWPDGLAILAAYNQAIAECAKRHAHVHLVDVHAAFLGHGIHCDQAWRATYRAGDPGYWLYGNLEDPNDRGYDCIRRLILLAMCGVFARAHADGSGRGPVDGGTNALLASSLPAHCGAGHGHATAMRWEARVDGRGWHPAAANGGRGLDLVGPTGFEPATSCAQGRRSSQAELRSVASRTMWAGGEHARRRSRPLDAIGLLPMPCAMARSGHWRSAQASAKSGILDVDIRLTGQVGKMLQFGVYRMNQLFSSSIPDPHMLC